MATTYTPDIANSNWPFWKNFALAYTDPKLYTTHNAKFVRAFNFLVAIQNEILSIENVQANGGGSLVVRNETGGSIGPGPVSVVGYDVANAAYLVDIANATAKNPASLLLLAALADDTNGIAYSGGTFTSAVDTTGATVGDPIYLAVGGGLVLAAPTGADQIIQEVGRVQTLANPGAISGLIRIPVTLGTSWLQGLSVSTAKIAANAVTAAKIGSGAATALQALFSDGAGNSAFRSLAFGDLPIATGIATLSSGVVTINTALALTGSVIVATYRTPSGTIGTLCCKSADISNGVSFKITSVTTAGVTQTLDNSTVCWAIVG